MELETTRGKYQLRFEYLSVPFTERERLKLARKGLNTKAREVTKLTVTTPWGEEWIESVVRHPNDLPNRKVARTEVFKKFCEKMGAHQLDLSDYDRYVSTQELRKAWFDLASRQKQQKKLLWKEAMNFYQEHLKNKKNQAGKTMAAEKNG